MCTKCAVQTPVGYRCRECVKGQQKVYFNAKSTDPLIQIAIAFPLAALAAGLLAFFSFGFFSFIIAFLVGPVVGGGIADLAYRAVSKRRSRYSYLFVAGAIIAGVLLSLVFVRPSLITLGIFTFTAVSGAIGRLRLGR